MKTSSPTPNVTLDAADFFNKKISGLEKELASQRANWHKLCVIIGVPSEKPDKVFAKLRLLMADIFTEDPISFELAEARKNFPALEQLRLALDEAMVATWRNTEFAKNSPAIVPVIKHDSIEFSSRLRQFGNWWRNIFLPNDHS